MCLLLNFEPNIIIMKAKQILILAMMSVSAMAIMPAPGKAQDAKEAAVKYRGNEHSGVVAGYQAGDDAVRGALLKRLAAAGLTDKKTQKGFYVFSGVNWTEIMPEKIDVYVRVDGSSSKATAYIMIAKGYDNFISAATDPTAVDNLKNLLNSLTADIADFQKAQALAAQQAVVAAAEADAKKAADEAARAAKRQAKAEARHAKKQEKLKTQQRKLSDINGQ